MTNKEMFKRIFGFTPELYAIIPCPSPEEKCKYRPDISLSSCHCSDWWDEEFTGSYEHIKRAAGDGQQNLGVSSELEKNSTKLEKNFVELDCISRQSVLKIREQIEDYLRGVEITLEVLVENDPVRPKMEGAKDALKECLNLIDKVEAEADNGKD